MNTAAMYLDGSAKFWVATPKDVKKAEREVQLDPF